VVAADNEAFAVTAGRSRPAQDLQTVSAGITIAEQSY
jgi:hypothetical protein